ncbi:MAG: hypothetical protein JJ913_16495 [Rhizobiaceae bacterium]|nr:hypothetical protein [Rhizobiaceae bacterium]
MLLTRMRAALPSPLWTLVGTMAWAAAMGASCALALQLGGRFGSDQSNAIIGIYALGGLLAFPVALYATRLFALGGSPERRFAAALLFLGVATMLAAGFVFSMHYRQYFAQWHNDFPSVGWVFQLLFTGANAVYQFAVLGTRLFFPLGFAALFVASLLVARQAR